MPDFMMSQRFETKSRLGACCEHRAYQIASPTAIHGKAPPGFALSGASSFLSGAARSLQDGHTKARIEGSVVPLRNRLLHDDRKSLERWLQSQSRYQLAEAELTSRRVGAELARRLRCTRVLGPPASGSLPFVKGLIFEGTASLLYPAAYSADVMLSMHCCAATWRL